MPDHGDAAEAVAALGSATPMPALVHLLTSTSTVVGLQARLGPAGLTWRGQSVALDPFDLDWSARQVAALAGRVTRPGDAFVDLSAPPSAWLKPVRTGAHVLLAGAPELFGAPVVRLTPAAATGPVLAELAEAVAAGRLPRPGASWGAAGLEVRGGDEALTLAVAGFDDPGCDDDAPGVATLLAQAASRGLLEETRGDSRVGGLARPAVTALHPAGLVGELRRTDGEVVGLPLLRPVP